MQSAAKVNSVRKDVSIQETWRYEFKRTSDFLYRLGELALIWSNFCKNERNREDVIAVCNTLLYALSLQCDMRHFFLWFDCYNSQKQLASKLINLYY